MGEVTLGYFIIALVTLFFVSCSSTEVTQYPSPEITATPSVSDDKPAVAAAEPIQPRFCNDDIYTRHIREEYTRQNQGVKLQDSVVTAESFKALRYQLPLEFSGAAIKPSPRVLHWISYFTGRGRSDFLIWLVRSESHRKTLLPLLAKEGLPPEFLFLAMIESGFSNSALSHAKAAGTWQFMKPTAEHYGLQVNHWVDERRDPSKSTLAAARYLKDLHAQFGDWYLAMAAYNAGPTRVVKAMRAMKTRDYWVLAESPYLRPETKNYVPKLLAALIVASHAETYGFNVVADPRNYAPTASVTLTNAYRVSEIASRLGVTEKQLKRWNPELMQGFTPPISSVKRRSYELKIPAGVKQKFASVEPSLERIDIADILIHKVKKGDTIASIARHYKIPSKKIFETNPKLDPRRLKLGSNINVPIPSIQGESVQAKANTRPPKSNAH